MTPASKSQTSDEGFVDDLKPGTSLLHGQYTVQKYLNAGGFGITYLAVDSLDRTIVIKECFPSAFCRRSNLLVQTRSRVFENELDVIVQLFLKEARSLAKLRHPNIVGVHQVFEGNNTAYMALDFIQGDDLFNLIEKRDPRLTPDAIRSLLLKLLDAIGAVHKAGLLHRDISPDNIIVTDEMEPTLIDFGAAREQASRKTRALSTLRIVKDGYSPQEFYLAGSAQGPSSDLYSLAATFYHVITGEVPPDSQTRIAAQVEGRPDPYVPLVQKTLEFDPSFCAALDRAISILPRARFQSARDWLDAIASKQVHDAPLHKPAVAVARISTPLSPRISVPLAQPDYANSVDYDRPVPAARKPRLLTFVAGGGVAAAVMIGGIVLLGSVPSDGSNAASAASAAESTAALTAASEPEAEKAAAGKAFETAIADAATAPPADVEVPLPAGSGPDLGISARIIQAKDGLPGIGVVTSGWSIELPFTTLGEDDLTLASAKGPAAAILVPGLRIVAVAGKPVASRKDVMSIIEAAIGTADNGHFAIALTMSAGTDGPTMDQSVDVAVVPYVDFPNGLSFRSHMSKGAWQTEIASPPTAESSGVLAGDVLVAMMPGREPITDLEGLRGLILQAAMAGTTSFSFAIRRDGLMWVQDITIGAGKG